MSGTEYEWMKKIVRRYIFVLLAVAASGLFYTAVSLSQSSIEEMIVVVPHPVLRQQAVPILADDEETVQLLQEMAEYLEDGVLPKGGISLPQVAVAKRGFVAMIDDEAVIMMNPSLVFTGEEVPSLEGCLSIPRTFGYVNRSAAVTVEYHDEDWIRQTLHLEDLEAFIVQHENDHLNGILIIDKLLAEAPERVRDINMPLE